MLLESKNLCVSYGRIEAVKDASITIEENEIVAVLGANGAGKSSLLNAIHGLLNIKSGNVTFMGQALPDRSTVSRLQHGLVLVPEGRRILVSLTVEENLRLGAYRRKDSENIQTDLEAIYERFTNLRERRHLPASALSGGEQQMLAIGRALMAKPKLLMLDEPSLGLSPKLIGEFFELLRKLNSEGLSILLVEQNTHKALQIAHRAYVLELGRIVAEGTPDDLLQSGKIEEAYLGRSA